MTRKYTQKKAAYTTFKKLSPGDRFRLSPSNNGPFVKFGHHSYEDARIGDDTTLTYSNVKVKRLPRIGIEPN